MNFTDETLTSVLLVSEHVLFREALSVAIAEKEQGLCISQAGDVEQALNQITIGKPDIVLLHLSAPAAVVMQKLHRLQGVDPDVSVIVLFDVAEDSQIRAAMQAGAAGCLDGSAGVTHLLQGLHAAANGDLALSKGIARLVATMLGRDNGAGPAEGGAVIVTPTPRELRVLELLSLGMTNRAIAKRLLLSESTVRAHVRSITQKLGSQNRVQAVARALSLGMIDSEVSTDEQAVAIE